MEKGRSELEARFDEAMINVYKRALKECGYNATRFLQMLYDHGGLETARILIRSSAVSDGYVALSQHKRLDLTVEALILNSQWFPLFSVQEREIARQRLIEYGFLLPSQSNETQSPKT